MKHIQWANRILNELGYRLENTIPETILQTAWSEVCRFQTNLGFVYLKKVPAALALEAEVIQLLEKQFQAHVPHILAAAPEYHCFLMQDAGTPLHEVFKEGFQADLLIDTMDHYTTLQLKAADHIEHFLKLGTPDWRLQQLPILYHQLLRDKTLLLADGLTEKELSQLQHLDTKLVSICEQLAQYNLPDTFGHADFHDKNILVNRNTHQTTLIDLGEVVITHPFFSFVNCLYRSTEHLNLSNSQYRQLQEACFQNWLCLESSTHLFEIITLIEHSWPIHAVLGEYRLIKSVDPMISLQLSRQGRFAGKLRAWIELATTSSS
jgi:aminoglycoside/choline kinase family phosphotransferase